MCMQMNARDWNKLIEAHLAGADSTDLFEAMVIATEGNTGCATIYIHSPVRDPWRPQITTKTLTINSRLRVEVIWTYGQTFMKVFTTEKAEEYYQRDKMFRRREHAERQSDQAELKRLLKGLDSPELFEADRRYHGARHL